MANQVPQWLAALNEEDLQFLKRFLFASGSLKALAKEYGISYPTVRARLDRLIAKAKTADELRSDDQLERLVRILVADGAIPASAGRQLIEAHHASAGAADAKPEQGEEL